MKLLADTSALLAVILNDDANHRAAARWVREMPHVRFLLTELILSEMVTRLAARAGADKAVAAAGELLASTRYELVFMDEDIFRGALRQMAKFADKKLSFADCASFELMDRLALEAAFTFDRDFRDCGYAMVPD